MPRALWKGAISFGLVHVPVALYPAAQSHGLSFDMIDKRDFSPIGYKRYNKTTGEEVAREHIVKGYQYEKGDYVVVSDEDLRQANVEATQTVDIVSFVDAEDVPPYHFETPYYLEPGKRGEKGYRLLRETLRRSGRIGIATVVIRSRQHIAAVIPLERVLVLNTLRYVEEIRSISDLALPDAGAGDLTGKELGMAERLVDDMTDAWKPEQFKDTYTDDVMALIERKIESGQTHAITPQAKEAERARGGAEVIDLVSLLRKSLERTETAPSAAGDAADDEAARPKRAAARKNPSRLTARKPPHRKRA
jgi:DNA end-binding protein Ku